jgi:multimeric flavodoxin WrbA
MKIVSIISSYRKNGNTARLVGLVEEELQSTANVLSDSLEIETIFLGHIGIELCRGCRLCFDNGESMCPLKDEVLSIRDKIVEADGLILASPVYVEDINGIMKNWIDRMAFNCHRPAFAGKTAIVLTTSGVGSSNHALKTMRNALTTWGAYVDGQHKFRAGELMNIEDMKAKYHHEIKEIADYLYHALKSKKALTPTLYSLIAFNVQQKYWQKNINSRHAVDLSYWTDNGWLEPRCAFYTANNASWIKVRIARLLGSIIAIFFI